MGKDNIKDNAKSYTYYTGLGFQMIAVIGIFTFIGYKIDESKSGDASIFTALFALLGVLLSLVSTIRSVMKKNKLEK